MGIDPDLMGDILTVSITVARGDTIKRHLNQEKAGGNWPYNVLCSILNKSNCYWTHC